MDVINKNNLESAPYSNLIEIIDDRSIVQDPRDKGGFRKRTFVYDADPLAKSFNFGDFPYIVVNFPSLNSESVSTNGKNKTLNWNVDITVRSARDGAGQGTTNTGSADLFSIGNTLFSVFNSVTQRQKFIDVNMSFMNLTKTDSQPITIDNKQLYEANYTLTFSTRLEISE